MNPESAVSFIRLFGLSCCCVLVVGMMAPPALAQNDQLSAAQLGRMSRVVQGWLREPIAPSNQQVYEQYFMRYYFPAMLRTDAESLKELGEMRSDLFERYMWDAHPQVQADLTAKAYRYARSTVLNNDMPAPIRYNALLVLGLLDSKYGSRSNPEVTPLPEANRLLAQIVVYCAEQQRLPNYLEVGALVGLERHAKYFDALDTTAQRQTTRALARAAMQTKFRGGASREVQAWIRLQAARAIANTKQPGQRGVFVVAIASIVADRKMDTESRVAAAGSLGKLDLTSAPAPAGKRASTALLALACTVANEEQEDANLFADLQRRSRGARLGSQSSRRFYMGDQGWVYQRRGLIAQLEQLKSGLTAGATAPGAEKQSLESISGALDRVITQASQVNTDFSVIDKIREMHSQVTSIAGCDQTDDANDAEEDPTAEPDAPAEGEADAAPAADTQPAAP